MTTQKCIYCGAKATRWCDLVLGFSDPDGDGLYSTEDGSELLRCDAPLCQDHAVEKGRVFFSGHPSIAGVETIDHCCGHAGDERHMRPITATDAQRMRYQHRCCAAGPLRLIPVVQPDLFAGVPR